jgi:hypothetical protein
MVVLPARGVMVRVPHPNNWKSKDPCTGRSRVSVGRAIREGGWFHSLHLRSWKPTAWGSLIEHTQFTALICLDKLSSHYVITGRHRRTLSQKSHPVAKEIAVPSNQMMWNTAFKRQRIKELETPFRVKKNKKRLLPNAGEASQIQISYAVTCGLLLKNLLSLF